MDISRNIRSKIYWPFYPSNENHQGFSKNEVVVYYLNINAVSSQNLSLVLKRNIKLRALNHKCFKKFRFLFKDYLSYGERKDEISVNCTNIQDIMEELEDFISILVTCFMKEYLLLLKRSKWELSRAEKQFNKEISQILNVMYVNNIWRRAILKD